MKILKKFGPIIQPKTIFSLTKTNISKKPSRIPGGLFYLNPF